MKGSIEKYHISHVTLLDLLRVNAAFTLNHSFHNFVQMYRLSSSPHNRQPRARKPFGLSESRESARNSAGWKDGKSESNGNSERARARSQFPPSVVSLLAAADDAVVAVGRGSHFHRA